MVQQVFHIDLDAFFVAVERVFDPSLNGKPVAVGGEPGGRGVVACASYEARTYGLRAGMPLTQAQRLCPQAIFIPGRFSRYEEASKSFMAILANYTPLLEPLSVDEAYLDMTGFESLYGPLDKVARKIKDQIRRELKVTASVGIAPSKIVAKVASDLCKPDGLLEVKPGDEASFLAPMPVGRLPGVGAKAEQKLASFKITTVGHLAATHPLVLRRIFGAWGDLLHLSANGKDHTQVSVPVPAKSISRETTFAHDTLDIEVLRGMLRYLGERVGMALRKEGKLARVVALKLRYADFQTISRHRTLKEPIDSDEAIFDAGDQLFTRALKERWEKVRLIGIGVSGLIPSGNQLSLFNGRGFREESLTRAIDSIRDKHGFTSIQRGLTLALGNHFPEEHGHFILKTPSLSR